MQCFWPLVCNPHDLMLQLLAKRDDPFSGGSAPIIRIQV
jgi:hypothetical protein